MARAIGSYPAGHRFKSYCRYQIKIWPHRQAVKTSPFHGEVSGSNPLGVTIKKPERILRFFFFFPQSGQFEMRDARYTERQTLATLSLCSLRIRLGSPISTRVETTWAFLLPILSAFTKIMSFNKKVRKSEI